MNIKGWQPIEKYFELNYDWVLIKYYNEMKKTSQQTIERSKYYSRIDYYDSLQDN